MSHTLSGFIFPRHIHCKKWIFTEMSHILSGVIYPFTYLVGKGYLLKCHIYCQVSYTPSHTLSEKDIYSNITYIVMCPIPCHIPCQKRIFTEMSHILSGVIYPVTYLVGKGYFLKYHIYCQVSYPLSHILTKTRFSAMSHTLSGVKSSVTYLDKNKISCNAGLTIQILARGGTSPPQ